VECKCGILLPLVSEEEKSIHEKSCPKEALSSQQIIFHPNTTHT
jgi:hypothetical protein